MPTAHLTDRTVVQVAGDDAKDFLQGIVTCNVETLEPGEARLGALLSPQGKILFDFLVIFAPDGGEDFANFGGGYFLDCRSDVAPDLVKRLTLYKLRSKVNVRHILESNEPLGVAAAWGEDRVYQEDGLRVRDGRLPELGERLYLWNHDAAAIGSVSEENYHAHRIALGIPEGGRDFAFADAFPHEALMDQLGGVDFKKGCYVGQEVVSRMQHRGTARTRILPLVFEEGKTPEPGSDVTAGAKTLGQTSSTAGNRGLATIRLDRLGDALAAGEPVRVGGGIAGIEKPAFATFAFPADTAAAAG
ncbi:YgfZ/GcvT domain-containing protein [Methylobacterium brachythecii]|uniref:Folate-binding protein n=1 Tax=Methylobacterium brachythecii TaxID=1176177 RepID=A0A7W6AKP4_9HYPH|nr:folate-binding protein YgfZ [Methylobacterium brachythecii]MBB3903474.1 hypothetical protein [Methylobacterium brachythecii]GLS44173.1 folate-binding protein [Methylobacterium brachythecii]